MKTVYSILFYVYFIMIFISLLFIAFWLPINILPDLLIKLSQLMITITVGLSALILALRLTDEYKLMHVRWVLILMLISINGFFVSYIDMPVMHRTQIVSVGVVSLMTLRDIFIDVQNIIKKLRE